MMLKELLEGLSFQCLIGDMEIEISDLKTDSRNVESGDLFIAQKGVTTDGHAYLEQAADRGAAAALVERPLTVGEGSGFRCVVLVDALSKKLAFLGSRFYQEPSKSLSVIGITGTNGKTSVAQMLGNALESQGKRVGIFGTIGNRIGEQYFETQNTTLEPIALQRLFRRAVDHDVSHLVMEVSSHGLTLGRVDYTHFSCAIFTNLTEDHLDFHGDMEAYYKAKEKLFIVNEGTAVVNTSDPYGERLSEHLKTSGRPVLTYGLSSSCDFCATQITYTQKGTLFNLTMADGQFEVRIPGVGQFQVLNALAVFASMSALGFCAEAILDAAAHLKSVAGRMERLTGAWPFEVFVDFAHTPDALKNVLEISRTLTRGRLKVVFGCGGDRDRGKRPVMGRIATELADKVYLTSDNPRSEEPEEILKEILAGIPVNNMEKVTADPDRHKAITMAVRDLQPGDVLIIAGKGHEAYQIVGTTKFHFDDKEEAEQALQAWKQHLRNPAQ